MASYEEKCERLRQLFDEVDNDSIDDDCSEHRSELDPFSDDGEFDDDPDYQPIETESETENETESETDELQINMVPGNEILDNDMDESEEHDEFWHDDVKCIPEFQFNITDAGIKINLKENSTPRNVFDQLFTENIITKLVNATNEYGKQLTNSNKPNTRNTRIASFSDTNGSEMCKFLGLCLLQGQRSSPSIRHLFTRDSIYFAPIFSFTMSGRRFEQILRCFNCHITEDGFDNNTEKLRKVLPLVSPLLAKFKSAFSPSKELSLDESLLLFRGRLSFRQYIKGKKAKYGIKFYTLTSSDGYVLSIEIYEGKDQTTKSSKTEALVLRLMQPYLNQGHHIFMDNFYNSVSLSEKLLLYQTHSSGTLRSNRRGLPKDVVQKKLRSGEIIWKRRGQIYVSKWKDKRDVLSITTAYHPKLIETTNRYGKKLIKPNDIAHYNLHMSGVDRADQMCSYYSSPRKTIRWYKKVLFHMLDVAVWNSYFLYKKQHNQMTFLKFRELLIKSLISLPSDKEDGGSLINTLRGRPKRKHFSPSISRTGSPLASKPGSSSTSLHFDSPNSSLHFDSPNSSLHFDSSSISCDPNYHIIEKIPHPVGYKRKTYFLRCTRCYANKKKKQTSFRCQSCPTKPVLCPECFGPYHTANI